MNSTPTEALRAEALESPLYLSRQNLAEKFVLKLFAQNRNSLCHSIYCLTIQDLTNRYWKLKPSRSLAQVFVDTAKYREIIIDHSQVQKELNLNCFFQQISAIIPPLVDNSVINKSIFLESSRIISKYIQMDQKDKKG